MPENVQSRRPNPARLIGFGLLLSLILLGLAEGVARWVAGPPQTRYFFNRANPALDNNAWLALFGDLKLKGNFNAVPEQSRSNWLIDAPGAGGPWLRANPDKLQPRSRQTPSILVNKPDHVVRVFCLGASTAHGSPGADGQTFSDQLDYRLQTSHSGQYEILNLASPGLDSFDMVSIVEETLKLSPDYYVLYEGHTEGGNAFFRSSNLIPHDPRIVRIQMLLSGHLRLYSLLRDLLVPARDASASPPPPDSEAAVNSRRWARQNQMSLTAANFSANLRRIHTMAAGAGAKVVLASAISNLHVPPRTSAHFTWLSPENKKEFDILLAQGRDTMDLSSLTRAYNIDPTYAEVPYLLGKVELKMGHLDKARALWLEAKDWDVVSTRAWEVVIQGMEQVATERTLPYIDGMKVAADNTGIPPAELFWDELHLRPEAHTRLADAIWPYLQVK